MGSLEFDNLRENVDIGNLREVWILAIYGKSGFWQCTGIFEFNHLREIRILAIFWKSGFWQSTEKF